MVDAAARVYDGRYAIDIRTFLAIVTLTMLTSFLAGVAMVPPSATDYVEPTTVVRDSYIVNVSKDNVCMKNNTKNDRPFGKHLLVDIMGVEGDFLNSEERLSKAMVDTAKDAGYVLYLPTAPLHLLIVFANTHDLF